MEYERMQQTGQLNDLIGKHFRDKYLNPPRYNGEYSQNLLESMKNFLNNKLAPGESIDVKMLPNCSGQCVLPVEYKGWKHSSIFPHISSKALDLMQRVEREILSGDVASTEIDFLFGTALYTQQNTTFIAIAITWRFGAALRRAKRVTQHIKIDANNLGNMLTSELLEYRLSRGLSAKHSAEFSRVLSQPNPSLPANFTSYSTISLRYRASLSPETICDHAYEAAMKHVSHHSPEEFDTHLAVLYVPAKAEVEADSGSPPAETTIHIARLWRSKAQLLQQLQKIPAKIDSRQLETILKERVSGFQGLEPLKWSAALSHQLYTAYNPTTSSTTKRPLAVPDDCLWLNHTAVTFHNWPVRSIIGFIATSAFWNTASHLTKPVSALRCALTVLSCGGPTSIHLHKDNAAQHNSDSPAVQATGSETSLTVAMAIAWTWASDKYTTSSSPQSIPVPITLEDSDEELRVISTPSIPQVQSVNTIGQSEKLFNSLDTRASVRHYNVEPKLVSLQSREMLWPTPIIPHLLLSGELPASNSLVLHDYGVTHIVVTSANIPCTFSSQVNYLKISENDDYVLQIQTFITYIESLGKSDHMVLVAGKRGCNRSAGMVIALVMKHAGLNLREAVAHVTARRNIRLAQFVKQALLKIVSQSNQPE